MVSVRLNTVASNTYIERLEREVMADEREGLVILDTGNTNLATIFDCKHEQHRTLGVYKSEDIARRLTQLSGSANIILQRLLRMYDEQEVTIRKLYSRNTHTTVGIISDLEYQTHQLMRRDFFEDTCLVRRDDKVEIVNARSIEDVIKGFRSIIAEYNATIKTDITNNLMQLRFYGEQFQVMKQVKRILVNANNIEGFKPKAIKIGELFAWGMYEKGTFITQDGSLFMATKIEFSKPENKDSLPEHPITIRLIVPGLETKSETYWKKKSKESEEEVKTESIKNHQQQ